jgi:hypothetical protein
MPAITATQLFEHDMLPSSTLSIATPTWITNVSISPNSTKTSAETSGAAFAGLAVLIALLALFVGALQLRVEYLKRRETQELEDELIALEAEISEVRHVSLQGRAAWLIANSGYADDYGDEIKRGSRRGGGISGGEFVGMQRTDGVHTELTAKRLPVRIVV